VLSSSVGATGLGLHPERSRPEPVAGADPLTHFLSAAPSALPRRASGAGKEKRGARGRRRRRIQRVKRRESESEES